MAIELLRFLDENLRLYILNQQRKRLLTTVRRSSWVDDERDDLHKSLCSRPGKSANVTDGRSMTAGSPDASSNDVEVVSSFMMLLVLTIKLQRSHIDPKATESYETNSPVQVRDHVT